MISRTQAAAWAVIPIPFIVALDHFLKVPDAIPGLSWHTHVTTRPWQMMIPVLFGGLLLIMYARVRLTSIGYSLLAGGAISNLSDLALHGYTWNMFPIPGTSLYCNLADLCLLTGALLMLASLGQMWRQLYTEAAI